MHEQRFLFAEGNTAECEVEMVHRQDTCIPSVFDPSLKPDCFAGALRSLVRQLSIDQFENEGRRVTLSNQDLPAKPPRPDRNGMFERSVSDPGVHRVSHHASIMVSVPHGLCTSTLFPHRQLGVSSQKYAYKGL